ncbi:uncharacterized protein LOC131938048 isoform X2 [Physella acuta]|nr:uncharacterized protein LOC131938048 isoform X2 [Physella acuta]
MGAMRFTIAVVLVYGVGVIGLLGISARRNRRLELMDKEVNKFIKSKLSKYEERNNRKSKKTVSKLISSLHSIIQTDETGSRTMPKLKLPFSNKLRPLLGRANSWSETTSRVPDTRPSLAVGPAKSCLKETVEIHPCIPLCQTGPNVVLHSRDASSDYRIVEELESGE